MDVVPIFVRVSFSFLDHLLKFALNACWNCLASNCGTDPQRKRNDLPPVVCYFSLHPASIFILCETKISSTIKETFVDDGACRSRIFQSKKEKISLNWPGKSLTYYYVFDLIKNYPIEELLDPFLFFSAEGSPNCFFGRTTVTRLIKVDSRWIEILTRLPLFLTADGTLIPLGATFVWNSSFLWWIRLSAIVKSRKGFLHFS